jgi:hypothetical protein
VVGAALYNLVGLPIQAVKQDDTKSAITRHSYQYWLSSQYQNQPLIDQTSDEVSPEATNQLRVTHREFGRSDFLPHIDKLGFTPPLYPLRVYISRVLHFKSSISPSNMNTTSQTFPLAQKDLTGRTVIVTGSNVGLGLETARYFYAMNPARLILAVRDVSKGETAKQSILDTASKAKGTDSTTGKTSLEVWQLDLSNFDSVKQFSKRCHEELDRLDILLNNAAVAAGEFSLSNDGYELS